MVSNIQKLGIKNTNEESFSDECLRQEYVRKPDAGNSHVRFDEGGGEIPTSTLLPIRAPSEAWSNLLTERS